MLIDLEKSIYEVKMGLFELGKNTVDHSQHKKLYSVAHYIKLKKINY